MRASGDRGGFRRHPYRRVRRDRADGPVRPGAVLGRLRPAWRQDQWAADLLPDGPAGGAAHGLNESASPQVRACSRSRQSRAGRAGCGRGACSRARNRAVRADYVVPVAVRACHRGAGWSCCDGSACAAWGWTVPSALITQRSRVQIPPPLPESAGQGPDRQEAVGRLIFMAAWRQRDRPDLIPEPGHLRSASGMTPRRLRRLGIGVFGSWRLARGRTVRWFVPVGPS